MWKPYEPVESLTEDQRRIAAISMIVDGLGDIDLHERAAENAGFVGREEPNELDYYAACRDAIDNVRASLTVSASNE